MIYEKLFFSKRFKIKIPPIKKGNNTPKNKRNDFLDSPRVIGLISGSIANPFCLPPLSVVYPFLFIIKKYTCDNRMKFFSYE